MIILSYHCHVSRNIRIWHTTTYLLSTLYHRQLSKPRLLRTFGARMGIFYVVCIRSAIFQMLTFLMSTETLGLAHTANCGSCNNYSNCSSDCCIPLRHRIRTTNDVPNVPLSFRFTHSRHSISISTASMYFNYVSTNCFNCRHRPLVHK